MISTGKLYLDSYILTVGPSVSAKISKDMLTIKLGISKIIHIDYNLDLPTWVLHFCQAHIFIYHCFILLHASTPIFYS